MFKNTLSFLGNYFLFGNFLAALGAAMLTHATAVILGYTSKIEVLIYADAFVFTAVLLVYNADRLIAAKYDRHSKRHYWIKENRLLLSTTALLTLPLLIWLTFILPFEAVLVAVILGLITFAYSFPLLLNYNKSLKERGLLKVFLIALVWSLATTLIPVFAVEGSLHLSQIFLLAAERFLFILPIAIISDMRDMRADKAAMIVTLPLRYGWRKIIRACILFCILFLAVILFDYWNDFLHLALPHLISGFYLLVLIVTWTNSRKELYYTGLLDGAVLLQALLVLLFNIPGL